MKICDLRTYALRAPLERPFYFSQPGWVTSRNSLVVELTTDSGISGFGEALCHGHQPPDIARATIETSLRELVVGQDPFDAGVLFEAMYNRTKDFGMKGAVVGAISAVDIALWDVIGQATGKPVHKLLGARFAPRSNRTPRILDLTLAAGLLLNPHVWGTAIGLAASLHLLVAIPPNPISRCPFAPLLEYDQSTHPFRHELVENPIDIRNGKVQVPTAPGLGITVNRAVLRRFSS